MDVPVAGRLAVIAVALALAGCQPPDPSTSSPTPTPTATPAAQAAPIALEVDALSLVLPWDVSATPSHRIECAYDQEAGAGCVNHHGDDRYALDLDLGSTDTVRAVESGIVRWAGAYPATSSWSCYGNSVAIDTRLTNGKVVTAFYAHLSAFAVEPGQPVDQGQKIGTAGSSGSQVMWKSATDSGTCPQMDPHLHFVLYENPSYVDATGKLIPATSLPEDPLGSIMASVKSPPDGGTPVKPEPWLMCARTSTIASPLTGGTTECEGLHAGDELTYTGSGTADTPSPTPTPTATPSPIPPPPVLGGTWRAPEDGATLESATVTLSATPTARLADVAITRVVFTAQWGDNEPVRACTAKGGEPGKAWKCRADLWDLGAKLGKITFSFDVFDDAGDVSRSPGGTRTVKLAAAPGPPGSAHYKRLCEPDSDPQECPPEGVRIRVTWKAASGDVSGYRVYWVSRRYWCEPSMGFRPPKLLDSVDAIRRQVIITRPFALSEGYFAIAAFNKAGRSKGSATQGYVFGGDVCGMEPPLPVW